MLANNGGHSMDVMLHGWHLALTDFGMSLVETPRLLKSDVEEFTGHSSDNIGMWVINA